MALTERITPQGRRVLKLFEDLKKKPEVQQGYPADFANKQHEGSDVTVILIAVVHEFGSPARGIPERSHMRSSFDENKGKLSSFSKRVAESILDGNIDLKQGLSQIGLYMENNHKEKLQSSIPPELSPSTKAARRAKGDQNPKTLIDTAQLLNSSTHKVKMRS